MSPNKRNFLKITTMHVSYYKPSPDITQSTNRIFSYVSEMNTDIQRIFFIVIYDLGVIRACGLAVEDMAACGRTSYKYSLYMYAVSRQI